MAVHLLPRGLSHAEARRAALRIARPATPPSGRTGRVVTTALIAAIAAYVVAYLAWTLWHWWGDRTVLSDIAPIPVELLAAGLAWWAARRQGSARTRAAWRLVALACVLWAGGEMTWCYLEVVRDTSPFPSIADALYLSFYPVMFAGLTLLPGRRTGRHQRLALALDVATVMLATLMLVWYLVVEPTVSSYQSTGLSEVLSLLYPAGDLILVLGATRAFMRRLPGPTNWPLLFLGTGAASLAVADVLYAHLELSNHYGPGTAPDALWLLAMASIAGAALAQRGRVEVELAGAPPMQVGRISRLPYIAVVVGSGLALYETAADVPGTITTLIVGVVGLTALVVWRQLTVMRENERLVSRLDRLAHTDALTGLPNRRQFFDVAERLLMRIKQNRQRVSLIMMDIDHFKQINDCHGHSAGDDVLEMVARRGAEMLRPTDVLARYAGDEFVVLLPGTGPSAANDVARRLGDRIAAAPFQLEAGDIAVTVSIGVATTEPDESLSDLIKLADEALYRAKAGGRNQLPRRVD